MEKYNPRKEFEKYFVAIGHENEKVLSVSCDSAKGAGMSAFLNTFPERSIEVGIAEQTAISMCAGLAETGMIPVISAITPFLTMRAYEQVRDDVGYANTNVKIVGSGTGLAYATLGSTHEAVEDTAVIRTIPNMTILNPGDRHEIKKSLEYAVNTEGPMYIRMIRQAVPDHQVPVKPADNISDFDTYQEGSDVLLIGTGTMVKEGIAAGKLLEEAGISTQVTGLMMVMPLEKEMIYKMCQGYRLIAVIEEHSVNGGLGTAISEILAEKGGFSPVKRFGVPLKMKVTGPYDEVLAYCGLKGDLIADKISELIKGE
jgi:transketolase